MVDKINLEYRKPLTICQDVAEQAKVNAANYHCMFITKDCGCVKKIKLRSLHFVSLQEQEYEKLQKDYDKLNSKHQKNHIELVKVWKISIRISRFIHLLLRRKKTMHFSNKNWRRLTRPRRTADV